MITPQAAVADIALIAAHYDELDSFYRVIWGTHLHHGYWITGRESVEDATRNLTHLVAQKARIGSGDRVCDFGCGYGASSVIFAREYDARVFGLTVSKKQFEHAKSSSAGVANVNFLLCDGLKNDFGSASFDAVVSIESSEHLPSKPAFFAEVMRLLRPGGRLVVTAWLSRERPGAREKRYLLEPICDEGRLPSMGSASEYREMLASAGFQDPDFEDLTCSVKKTWSVCALRTLARVSGDPSLRQRLFDPEFSNRVFAKTVLRLWMAYRTGSMRYGLFFARK